MSFNSTISTLGIVDPRAQQAIKKLLENSMHQKDLIDKNNSRTVDEFARIKKQISNNRIEITERQSEEIADMISESIGTTVRDAQSAAEEAGAAAERAVEEAGRASDNALAVEQSLLNVQTEIEERAETATQNAIAEITSNISDAVSRAEAAVGNAQNAAAEAGASAENAAAKAEQAENTVNGIAGRIDALKIKNLSSVTFVNSRYDQYRKVAILPSEDANEGAAVFFTGTMDTPDANMQVHVAITQTVTSDPPPGGWPMFFRGYLYGFFCVNDADIVVYRETDGTYSVYLKGARSRSFRHNLIMSYNEKVTPVESGYTTTVPTGIRDFSFFDSHQFIVTRGELDSYSPVGHTHDDRYPLKNHTHYDYRFTGSWNGLVAMGFGAGKIRIREIFPGCLYASMLFEVVIHVILKNYCAKYDCYEAPKVRTFNIDEYNTENIMGEDKIFYLGRKGEKCTYTVPDNAEYDSVDFGDAHRLGWVYFWTSGDRSCYAFVRDVHLRFVLDINQAFAISDTNKEYFDISINIRKVFTT